MFRPDIEFEVKEDTNLISVRADEDNMGIILFRRDDNGGLTILNERTESGCVHFNLKHLHTELERLSDMICARDAYIEQVRPKNRKRTLPLLVLREWLNDYMGEKMSMSRLREVINEFFQVGRKQ